MPKEIAPVPDVEVASDAAPVSRTRRRRAVKLVLVSIAVIVVLLVGLTFAFSLYLRHLFNSNVRHADLLPSGGPSRIAAAGDAQNILLLGSDSRTLSLAGSRSDVIQLVHISKSGTPTVSVIHFPRDLYVAIPGHGKAKINAAYAWGGAKLLVQTMENLLDLHIDHVVQIGFTGFAKVTDDLGGVDLYVRQPVNEPSTGYLDVGMHHLTGAQALAFVRERHQLAEGDIDRGRDQQAWLKAVAAKVLTSNLLYHPFQLTSFVQDIAASMTVDQTFSADYVQGLATRLRSAGVSHLRFFTAPYAGFANCGDTPTPRACDGNGGAGDIDVVNVRQMAALGTALRLDKMASYTNGLNNNP